MKYYMPGEEEKKKKKHYQEEEEVDGEHNTKYKYKSVDLYDRRINSLL